VDDDRPPARRAGGTMPQTAARSVGFTPLGGFAVRTTLNSQVWRPRPRG